MSQLANHLTELFKDTKKDEILELICDDIIVKKITEDNQKEIESCSKLKVLCFNFCKLSTLDNLPNISTLEEIQLSDNFLSGKELQKLKIYPHLTKLKICNNKIDKFEDLECLKDLKDLNFLDLTENPITKYPNYRNKIYEILPSLVYLDFKNKEGEAYPESDEEEDDEEEENEEGEESFIEDDFVAEEGEEEEDEENEEDEEDKPSKKKKTE